jgi:pyruvate kinase
MGHTAHKPQTTGAFEDLIRQLESLHLDIEQLAEQGRAWVLRLTPGRQASAENLLHYLALRSRDLRPLQIRLAHLGLSSIGRSEPHVLATLDAVLHNLFVLSGEEQPAACLPDVHKAFLEGAARLEQNTIGLLGEQPGKRRTHIMVTLPAETAEDFLMVQQLLMSGVDCVRINCSHDDPAAWSGMIKRLSDAKRVTGRPCRILMDLGGTKLRTGPMELMPAVQKIRPARDSHGKVTRPARIWLTAEETMGSETVAADACITVNAEWLADCKIGDRVLLRDARDSRRSWRIKEITPEGCWAEARKTTYVVNGTVLRLRGYERKSRIRALPGKESVIKIQTGDVLLMSLSDKPGQAAIHDDNGDLLSPGKVCMPIPEIYRDARPGESVCFDDGRISGIIEKRYPGQLQIRISHTRRPQERLGSDKGVNFPDTHLGLPALGNMDLQDLEFIARHADMIGLSFTNTPDDVRDLRERLHELGRDDVGVVLKIETRQGFANLPGILLEALKFPNCGVMIARGDLAVECGFERMAELQEEILWLCEAAHVPVIWATQVLEGLVKRGHVSRAEISDAAMSRAAECVMLNKGPYIIEAVHMLDDILQRPQGHQSKKRSMLRKLQLAREFTKASGATI